MKESLYFNCKKKGYIDYDCPRKEKIIAISESVNENNNS